ncbi:MAG: hypothetical protein V4717_20190 [Bacteroidota bacterium]
MQETTILIAIITGSITLLVAVAGIIGNWYLSNVNRKNELQQQEYQLVLQNLKGFWEYQSNLYSETLKVVSILVLSDDISSDDFLNAYKRFWELYWCELPTCESNYVASAMVDLKQKIYDKKHFSSDNKEDLKLSREELNSLLLNLANAVRKSSLLLEYSEKIRNKITKDTI